MRICIGGRNNIAVNICEHLLSIFPKDCIYAIPGRNDNGKDGYQRSFLKYVNLNGIKVVKLDDIYEWDDLVFLSLEFDRIIRPDRFVSKFLYNIHFSLLPAYKGVYTSALPILNGEKFGGVTFHYIDKGIDTGDIIDQLEFEIPNDYKAIDLYLRYIKEGTNLVIKNLDNVLTDNIISRPQSPFGSSYYSKNEIDYSNLLINLNCTAYQIDCQIRAFNYRPFQLPIVNGYSIFYSEILDVKSVEKPGTIIENNEDYILIATIDYDVVLYKDQLSKVIDFCKINDVEGLLSISHLSLYINEHEKNNGWTPLIVAAYYNSFDVVKLLVQFGADVNIYNNNGTTAVMYAKDGCISSGSYDIIDFLLLNGANPNKKDNRGLDLFDYIDNSMPIWQHVIKYKK